MRPSNGGKGIKSYLRRIESKIDDLTIQVQLIKEALFPGRAINPKPSDGETNVSIDVLSWEWQLDESATEIPSGNVHLDIVEPPKFVGNSLSSFWPPDGQSLNLLPGTKYYWRVDTVGSVGTTTGTTWSFTTVN